LGKLNPVKVSPSLVFANKQLSLFSYCLFLNSQIFTVNLYRVMQLPFFKSLRCQIPLMVLVGGIPVILISIGFASLKTTEIITREIQGKLALEAHGLQDSVSQWNETNVLALQNLSRQPAIVSLDAKQQQPILQEIVKTYDRFYLVHTTDLTGMNIARSDNLAPKTYSDRLWFQGAKAGRSITYETLIGKTSKKPAVCIAAPIRQQDRLAAIATSCSSLEKIAQRVSAVNIGKTGYGLVVDDAGKIIAHRDPVFTSGENLTDLKDYPPVANLLAGNNGYVTFTDESNTEWVAYGNRLDNGWGVLILQTKAEAFQSEQQFQQILIVTAAFLLGGISILIWLLISSLVEPIDELSNAAVEWSQGKLDRTAKIKRQDELGILANSFNHMARQLQESFLSLNHRTSELNNLLEAKNRSEREQRNAKEKLQQQVYDLKRQLEAVQHGDLTVRAVVTDDEIGQIAQSYNKTIEHLRKIVAEVQSASQTLTSNTSLNETTIARLSTGALQQQTEITAVLQGLTNIAPSIQTAVANARQADRSVRQAAEKLQVGDEIIDRTAKQMMALGQSSLETSEQVKRLAKASQKITKTIGLIRKIALQTNVLAVNASIEAARAGEEGLGFTVVADEVQSLAAQSAQAATDIEKLISEIQLETNKVVRAMETSSKEVLAGSQSVQEVRGAIEHMAIASIEIDNLLKTVNNMVSEQSQANQNVTETIKSIATIAEKNSLSAADVASSFKELLTVAQKLETSVSQFKVG
jgi:methyl-accepting chemotaxis protein PixJ